MRTNNSVEYIIMLLLISDRVRVGVSYSISSLHLLCASVTEITSANDHTNINLIRILFFLSTSLASSSSTKSDTSETTSRWPTAVQPSVFTSKSHTRLELSAFPPVKIAEVWKLLTSMLCWMSFPFHHWHPRTSSCQPLPDSLTSHCRLEDLLNFSNQHKCNGARYGLGYN